MFGSVVSGRPSELDGVENMVGLFIHTVPVRVTFDSSESIGELLQKMQREALGSEPHLYTSLAEIQSASGLGNGLLDHIVVFENYPLSDKVVGTISGGGHADFTITGIDVFDQTHYDLAVVIIPGSEIAVRIDFNNNVY